MLLKFELGRLISGATEKTGQLSRESGATIIGGKKIKN